MMMRYGGGTASMNSPELGRIQKMRTYRESIRRASVPSGLCRSAVRFFPGSGCDAAAGEGAYYCWSSSSSASSPAASDASVSCSAVSLSFSSDDGDLCFSSCLDGVEELRAIALQMVRDGYMEGLIRAFAAAGGGGLGFGLGPGPDEELILGRWFSELDVEWVLLTREWKVRPHLDLEDGCAYLLELMERWIKALKTMVQVFCITPMELHAKMPATVRKAIRYLMLLATGKMVEREQEVALFARFAEASILRMLDFVDAIAAAALDDDQAAATEALQGMLQVYTCFVDESPAILALFKEASGNTSMVDAMNGIFLWKRSNLSDAIWSMMEVVRASFLTDECWRVSPASAGGVHKTTRLVMNYIRLLWRNEGALNLVLQDQRHRFRMFLSEHDGYCSSSVADLIKKMISSSEKQLEKASNFISDPGLRYIFLMNNFSFISEKVPSLLLPQFQGNYKIESSRGSSERLPPMEDCVNRSFQAEIEMDSNLDGLIRVQGFMEAYLDASWEPVMSCLYHDIPRGFLKSSRALDKFELELQRTYDTQRLWKVPNPELRKRLRKAIIEKVISGYNQYLTQWPARGENNRSAMSTPLELEELLEELFEG